MSNTWFLVLYRGATTTSLGATVALWFSLPDDYSSIQNIVFNAATLTQIKKQKFPEWIGTVCYAALLLSMNGGGIEWDAHTQKNTKDDFKLATRSECHSKKAQLKTVSVDETQFPAQKFLTCCSFVKISIQRRKKRLYQCWQTLMHVLCHSCI